MLCELIQLCLLFLIEVLPVKICCGISQHIYISGYTCTAYNMFLVTCEALTVLLRVQIVWGVMLCPWASSSWCFRGSYCLHCQGEAAWPWRLGTAVLYETSWTTCPRSQHHVPGEICCHAFHCYRQTHGLSNVCCDTRGKRRVDQMCEVSEFVVGNVVGGFECWWSQQNIPWAVLYCTQRSQNLWIAGFRSLKTMVTSFCVIVLTFCNSVCHVWKRPHGWQVSFTTLPLFSVAQSSCAFCWVRLIVLDVCVLFYIVIKLNFHVF